MVSDSSLIGVLIRYAMTELEKCGLTFEAKHIINVARQKKSTF